MLSDRNRELWRVNKFIWLCLGFTGLWLAARWNEFAPAPRRPFPTPVLPN